MAQNDFDVALNLLRTVDAHEKPVGVASLKQACRIGSERSLNLLRLLRSGGFLKLQRGAGGGFLLARDLRTVKYTDVARAVCREDAKLLQEVEEKYGKTTLVASPPKSAASVSMPRPYLTMIGWL